MMLAEMKFIICLNNTFLTFKFVICGMKEQKWASRAPRLFHH